MNAYQYKPDCGMQKAETIRGAVLHHSAFCILLALLLLSALRNARATETLPLEIHQDFTFYNVQSRRGAPISTVSNVPPGSDGRMTLTNQSTGSVNLPTTNQFKGFLAFGGLPGLGSNDWVRLNNYSDLTNGTSTFSATVAAEMGLPLGHATPGNNSSPVV